MRHGVPTCQHPDRPECIYFRNMYHTFFWGPFADEAAAVAAIKTLNAADPEWDYEPFCVIHGMNPLPKDYVFGFPKTLSEVEARIRVAADDK